jgi:3D (Asp-Asp-Asp) domain-containing protein/predicted  nucleic acid-binding Zn-ribbon protein
VLVFAVVSAATAAAPGTQYRGKAADLQQQASLLASRAHSALLDLYVLDTRFGAAQKRLAALQVEAEQLREQQVLLAQHIAATKRILAVSQQQLGANLRLLYKQDETDPLAVVLGAASLSDALTQLDDLNRVANQSEGVVADATAARTHLAGLRRALSARRTQVVADLAAAKRTARQLASARAERLSFITQLRSEQRLKVAQVGALEAKAKAAELKAQQLQAAALTKQAATLAPVGTPDPAPAPSPGGHTLTVSSTGYSLVGHTSTGIPVGWGVVAVDPTVIPLGTRLTIPGYGEGVAADTGSSVRGADIDLWFPTLAQARAWGRRTVTITLH